MDTLEKRRALKSYFKKEGLSQKKLAEILGISQPAVGALLNGKTPFGKKTATTWAEKFGLNASWLLIGEGPMLKTDTQSISAPDESVGSGKVIPFYDAEVAAGMNYGMEMAPSRPVGMIEIGSVLQDSESAIRVYGNSMVPNYPAGCVIGLKLHTDSFIEPGRVYVVETRENRYLKRLYYTKDRKSFHCLSDNQMKYDDGPRKGELYYQDFEIPIDEVIRLHRVVGVIKRNIL